MEKTIIRAYKFRLYPNKAQIRRFEQFSDAAKFAWNWTLRFTQKQREDELIRLRLLEPLDPDKKLSKPQRKARKFAIRDAGRKAKELGLPLKLSYNKRVKKLVDLGFLQSTEEPTGKAEKKARRIEVEQAERRAAESGYILPPPELDPLTLYRCFCQERDTNPDFAWIKKEEIYSHAYKYPIDRLVKAYKDWFNFLEKKGPKKGPPQFKGRTAPLSFTLQLQNWISVEGGLRVPGLKRKADDKSMYRVRCRPNPEDIIKSGKPCEITVRRVADRWYATVVFKEVLYEPKPTPRKTAVGVDLGLNSLVTLYDGEGYREVEPPKCLARAQKILAKLQRQQAKKVVGSKRHFKQRMRVARLHAQVANTRYDFLQKLSCKLVDEYDTVVVEGFDVSKLVHTGVEGTNKQKASKRLKMLDASWGELRRQLDYKSNWNDRVFIVPPKNEPTDQTCSECGALNKPSLKTSVYKCSECGFSSTRQRNTAKLLLSFATGNGGGSTPGGGGTYARGVEGKSPSEADLHTEA